MICETCRQDLEGQGSHYHCGGCDSLTVTGMYGHHTTFCKVVRGTTEFHHCGPNGDCELTKET